jgi:cobalt-zinc-cadmium efflux system membrane fusion protein
MKLKLKKMNIKEVLTGVPAMLLAMMMACNDKPAMETEAVQPAHHEDGTVAFTDAQYKTTGITLAGIEQRQMSGTLKVNGLLDVPPQNQVSISVPFGGILKNTELLQGMWVNKGQVIARMEHPDYIQMQQDYLDAASQLVFAEKEYRRQEELNRENVSAVKTYEKTTAEYNSLKYRVEGLKQKLSLLNLDAQKISNTGIVNSIPLVSPIGGYVTEVNANIGKFVQPNEVIFEIVDTRHLHVELMVFEKDVPVIKEGQKVRYTLANGSIEREADVHLIGREISAERTIRVHCHMKSEDKNLLPGMYLKAIIETGTVATSVLPSDAIVDSEGKSYIFIQLPAEEAHGEVEKENTGHEHTIAFRAVPVTTGASDNGYTEITLPQAFDAASKNIVVKGAYDLLSKMNNSEEGHAH